MIKVQVEATGQHLIIHSELLFVHYLVWNNY